MEPPEARELVALGHRITAAAARQLPVRHPENTDIAGVTFTEFARPFAGPDTVSRNAVIVAPGRIDRSPCGTGTCARLAVLHARGQLAPGQGFVHESIIGSRFEGRIVATVAVGPHAGVVPEITGRAWLAGLGRLVLAPGDPFPEGFLI